MPDKSEAGREFKDGQLYRLADGGGWCRHGLVMIQKYGDKLIAMDTYWGAPDGSVFNNGWYQLDHVLDRLEFVLDLTKARKVYRDEFDVYADKDRAYIPTGGGSERFFVALDATPSLNRQREKLESEIASLESRIEWDGRTLERKRTELAALGAQAKEGA